MHLGRLATTTIYRILCHILSFQLAKIYLISTLPILLIKFLGGCEVVVVECCHFIVFE